MAPDSTQIAAYIAGALAIDPATGMPGPREIVSPGFYFRIEELACGAKPGTGKIWIRHQNCVCYEVDAQALRMASHVGQAGFFRERPVHSECTMAA